jgi:uncharacterized Rmd1/YagE family protein
MQSKTLSVRARLFGQSIEPRRITGQRVVSRDPTTVETDRGGYVVLYRYGVAVFFNTTKESELAFLQQLIPSVSDADSGANIETLDIEIVAGGEDSFEGEKLIIPDAEIPRLLVVADILAKSVFLDDYEQRATQAFDRIEPLAENMHSAGHLPRRSHRLLRHVGEILQLQHRMVARAQVGEKPDVLWYNPELEHLWHRLENEYEIGERQLALERKLDLISNTVGTLLSLLQDRRTLRVEWYIVILIVIEIMLTLYELFFRHS